MGCSSSSPPPAEPRGQAPPVVATEKPQKSIGHFQVTLEGNWQDYNDEEDRILKRAFMSGFSNAKYHLRGNDYKYDFRSMNQINQKTGKERKIRPPHKMKPPSKPLVPEGPTMTIKVRQGQAGKKIKVPHPKDKSVSITVVVPKKAKTGQELLIPVPPLGAAGSSVAPPAGATGSSTGAKTAKAGAVAMAAGLVVGGAILYLDEDASSWAEGVVDDHAPTVEAAAGDVGTWAEGAAEDIAEWAPDAAEDAGDWIVTAGDDAGAFLMDLF